MLAISVDSIHSHRIYQSSLGSLPFPLLSDWFKEAVKMYGVFNEEKHIGKRSTFVVDKEGILQFVNTSFDARDQSHYDEVLTVLEKLH